MPHTNGLLPGLLLSSFVFVAGSIPASAATIYALIGNNNISSYSVTDPGTRLTSLEVTGQSDAFVAIDFNPTDNQLYALGAGSRLYRINLLTGAAIQAGPDGGFIIDTNGLGMDFDPVTGNLRLSNADDATILVNPITGLQVATGPNHDWAPGDVNNTGNLSTRNIVGLAYGSNSILYGFEGTKDVLVTINQTTSALTTVGSVGYDVAGMVGFDIDGATNIGYLVSNDDILRSVNLQTGGTTEIGLFSPIGFSFRGISVAPATQSTGAEVPEPSTWVLLATGSALLGLRRRVY